MLQLENCVSPTCVSYLLVSPTHTGSPGLQKLYMLPSDVFTEDMSYVDALRCRKLFAGLSAAWPLPLPRAKPSRRVELAMPVPICLALLLVGLL